MTTSTTPAHSENSTSAAAEAAARLDALWAEIRDLRSAQDLLSWDQETMMPAGGVAGRSRLAATLAGLKHRKLVDPELGDALAACEAVAGDDDALAAKVRVARLDVDRAVKVPEDLVRELAAVGSEGLATWQQAKVEADFSKFRGVLERLVDLRRQEAAAIDPEARPYDVHLDAFEPGSTEAELEPLFANLRSELGSLVRAAVESGVEIDEAPVLGQFETSAQEAFGREMSAAVGFDYQRGRLDPTAHPFCIGIDPDDVRLTWRAQDDDFRPALFGILHETGHGLYEQGLGLAERGTPLGDAVSLGIHESQSRLWENHVARSRSFWRWATPRFRHHFPGHPVEQDLDRWLDRLWPALHTVRPSLIRTEADEATYNLHIVVRFELERALFADDVRVADLPGAWNDLYRELLGIVPENDAEGVLQDIHWSMGMFGYFPTYTLGTMAAAQLFAAAERDLGDLDTHFVEGRFDALLDWLRDRIHRHGSRHTAATLIERATGEPLGSEALVRYLGATVSEAYGLPLEPSAR